MQERTRADASSGLFMPPRFRLGVLLYELATGAGLFGQPETAAGMRDRLWRRPTPSQHGSAPTGAGAARATRRGIPI